VKFIKLLYRNLLRQPLRTGLTALGVAASTFIFTALTSLDHGTRAMVQESSDATIITVFQKYKACPPMSKLPVSYADRIAELEHVVAVMPERFLLSNCKTTTDLVAVHGVDPEKFRQFREIEIPEDQYEQFAAEKGAAIIGQQVAAKYGWDVGDQVTLQQLGGVSFTVRGIFRAEGTTANLIIVDRGYLELSTAQSGLGWATVIYVKVEDESHVPVVANTIDATFANYQAQTVSSPEDSFILGMISDFADMVGFVQVVGYLSLLLLLAAVANSVSMSVRERLREMAILKLVGFRSERVASLALGEAVVIALLGAAIGVACAALVLSAGGFTISIEGFTITPEVTPQIIALGLGLGALLGYAGAYVPSRGGSRRPIISAMREVD
jgi:putative ABC transport system permease protein